MEGFAGGGEGGRGEEFAVSPDSESAAARREFESLNVCRVAALLVLLSRERGAIAGVASALEEMGFSPALATGRLRLAPINRADLSDQWRINAEDENRVALWSSTQTEADASSGVAFLLAVLGSPLERESAAAAAALWRRWRSGDRDPRQLRGAPISFRAMEREEDEAELREWNPDIWRSSYERLAEKMRSTGRQSPYLDLIVEQRLRQALRSPDPITVSLAAAGGLPSTPPPIEPPPHEGGIETGGSGTPKAATVSTMIHGTWGWKGNWWRPGGGFHRFVLAGLRPNLYARGARFGWSGFYRESHRVRACSDFREWSEEIASGGLQTVFGHSYGGEVAARAVLEEVPIGELVLLSTPVTEHVIAAVERGIRVVDVRLRFDPVLALARTGQKLPTRPNVTTVRLKRWTLDHSATHDERVWAEEDVAARAGL